MLLYTPKKVYRVVKACGVLKEHNPAISFLPGRTLATCDFNHIKPRTWNSPFDSLMSDVCQNIDKSVQELTDATNCPHEYGPVIPAQHSEDAASHCLPPSQSVKNNKQSN